MARLVALTVLLLVTFTTLTAHADQPSTPVTDSLRKARILRNTGIILAVGGFLLVAGGTGVYLMGQSKCGCELSGNQLAGAAMAGIGGAALVSGVPLSIVGAYRMRVARAQLSMTPDPGGSVGGGLRLEF
jgi:hypothetical protein